MFLLAFRAILYAGKMGMKFIRQSFKDMSIVNVSLMPGIQMGKIDGDTATGFFFQAH